MDFKRRKIRGRRQDTFKEWLSDCGNYRVTWRSEVSGISVTPGYHADVLSHVNGRNFWSFAAARRPYKTFEKAVEACEKNKRLWTRFCAIKDSPRKGRVDRVRALDASARIGKGAACHKIMSIVPAWVTDEAEGYLLRMLHPGKRGWEEDE